MIQVPVHSVNIYTASWLVLEMDERNDHENTITPLKIAAELRPLSAHSQVECELTGKQRSSLSDIFLSLHKKTETQLLP